jgi:aminobenzoyl-glutamate transport protein
MDTPQSSGAGGVLGWIERVGNKLPEPAILFAILALVVVLASGIASAAGWQVQEFSLRVEKVAQVGPDGAPVLGPDGAPVMVPKVDENGKTVVTKVPKGDPLEPRSLMTGDGVYWMLSSMIRNFTGLPALGLVFTGMLGIGLAEKFGLFSALMRAIALATPKWLLTPVIVFIGANASVASDAGYIILPPLAAALYLAMGRHPVAGLAAAFAGVAGGFGGGLFPTAADGFLAGEATRAAHIIDQDFRQVIILHNWYFKSASAVVVMLAGWFVTDRIVEPRLMKQRELDSQDTSAMQDLGVSRLEKKGLAAAMLAMAAVLGTFFALVLIPGAPLHGDGQPTLANRRLLVEHGATVFKPGTKVVEAPPAAPGEPRGPSRVIAPDGAETLVAHHDVASTDPLVVVETPVRPRVVDPAAARWSQVIVPLILFLFLIPGMVYGVVVGTFRTQKDFIDAIYHGIRTIVPVLAIAFFMGQFVNYFSYSGMDRMLAFAGGAALIDASLPTPLLIVLFVLLVVAGDFAISGMLSKYALLAPIFIPMFMLVGISPELMTASYRIGDSVVNIITPLNSYLLIILVVLQKYKKEAGLGSLISLMLPYSVVFFVVWTGFLLVWMQLGIDLGPGSGLGYSAHAAGGSGH